MKRILIEITPYDVRERVKALAGNGTPADCAELILLMHHERSRGGWEGGEWERDHGPHPSFERYAAAYVAQPSWVARVTQEVCTELWRRYPPEPSACLPSGRSEWTPVKATRLGPG